MSPQQLAAIELLVIGRTDSDTAAQLGTARETVSRWRHQNPLFVATMNERRLDVWRATRERLRNLGAMARDVVEQHLRGGDLRAALALLKHVSEQKFPAGSTNVPDVIDDMADDFTMTVLIRDLRMNRDNLLARGLWREWLDEQ